MQVKGVDLSEHNGSVDFSQLKAAGVEFVILRIGFGGDYPGQQDKRFEENVEKAEAAGLPWGAYHYAYAVDGAGGRAEAAHALRLLKDRKPAYGLWYDMEDSSLLGGRLAEAAEAFCSAVQAAGVYAGVYANLNWWNSYLTSPVFDRFDRWCAQFYRECQLEKPYGMWQFTDCLEIGGKLFDGSWAYKDYPALTENREEGKAGMEKRYQTIGELPGYAKDTIKKLCRMKKPNGRYVLNGLNDRRDANGYPTELNLSEDLLRVLVIIDGAGGFDK